MRLQRHLTVIAVGVCCVLAMMQSIPTLVGSFYLINATSQLLNVYLNYNEQLYIPSLENKTALDETLKLLENARQWYPYNSLTYRWLIKVNAVRQDWQAALAIADLAVGHLKPDSRLQKNELALPYFYKIGQQQICDGKLQSSFTNLDRLIDDENSLREFADTLLYQGQPVAARGAYCVADQRYGTKNSQNVKFRNTMLAIMTQQPDAKARLQATSINDAAPEKYTINSSLLTIPGNSLYWMTQIPFYKISFGTHLGMENTEMGVFWWSGQAIAIVDVQRSGEFKIDVRVRDSDPASTRMALGINGKREHYFELTNGNNTWQTISSTSRLEPGLYSINLWFLNNETIDGKDRDGAVQWLQVQPAAIAPLQFR